MPTPVARVPATVGRSATVTPTAAPAGIVPTAQVTGRPSVQPPCVAVAATAAAPAGTSTRTVARRVASGPWLATRPVSVAVSPAFSRPGTSDVTAADRSALSPNRTMRVLPASAT